MSNKTTVLIVEDEPVIAAHVCTKLLGLGYEVPAVASNANEAFLAASAVRPDLVLMDIDLEGSSDGISAGAKINSELGIPIVFLTAHDDMPTLLRAQDAEPFGYMTKPVASTALVNSIETALRRHKRQNEQRLREVWLETQLKCVGEGLIATNHDGIVWFINPEAERLLGVSAADVIERPFRSAIPLRNQRTGAPAEDLIRLALLGGKTVTIGHDYVVEDSVNRRIVGELAVSHVKDEPIGVVFTFRDGSVESFRPSSIANNVVIADSFDCLRKEVDIAASIRRTEAEIRAKLPDGTALSLRLADSPYAVEANDDLINQLLTALAMKAEGKLPGGGMFDLSVQNLDFEQTRLDGAVTRYVRLRVAYHRHMYSESQPISHRHEMGNGLIIDSTMALIQRALQLLRATAHEGSAPGVTYLEIDIPAAGHRPAVAGAAASVIVIEPDAAVRSALCESYLALENVECLGAADVEDALDWIRVNQGSVDVVILSQKTSAADVQQLANEAPSASFLTIGGDHSVPTDRTHVASQMTFESCAAQQLRERLTQLLESRKQLRLCSTSCTLPSLSEADKTAGLCVGASS